MPIQSAIMQFARLLLNNMSGSNPSDDMKNPPVAVSNPKNRNIHRYKTRNKNKKERRKKKNTNVSNSADREPDACKFDIEIMTTRKNNKRDDVVSLASAIHDSSNSGSIAQDQNE